MRGKYSESQRLATEKYMQDKHTIRVVVTKDKKVIEYEILVTILGFAIFLCYSKPYNADSMHIRCKV